MFMRDQGLRSQLDTGFGQPIAWDINLLDGFDSEFVDVRDNGNSESFWSLRLKHSFGMRLREVGATALWLQGWQVAAYWQAAFAAKAAGVEVWLRGETNSRSTSSGAAGTLKKVALRRLFSIVDQFLFVGEANREFYLEQGVTSDRLTSAPYCVDNERFRSSSSEWTRGRATIRERWRIPENAFCVAFVGKFVSKKRPFDLVKAADGLKEIAGGRPIHLLWVGSGELGNALREATEVCFDSDGDPAPTTSGLRHRVAASFVGFLNQSEISKAYTAADCLVLPSDAKETWGLVVNEAMACGLPCITSDACGCAEDLIRPVGRDFCYPVGDIDALRRCLAEVATRPPSPALISSVIDRYDYLRTVEAAENLYLGARGASRRVSSSPGLS